MDEVFLFLQHDVHLLLGHGAAHQVGTAVAVASQITHYLHNLLLIHKTAVGNIQNRCQSIIHIFDFLRVFLVFYVFRYRVHGTRSVK